jgi:hypothetical protein
VLLTWATPAAASAAITSNVTTPADSSHVSVDQDVASPTMHVAGTSSEPDGPLDIVCYFGTLKLKLGEVTLTSGSFAGDLPMGGQPKTQNTCVLRAVAHNDAMSYPPGSVTTQTGPRVTIGRFRHSFYSGTTGPTYNFDVVDPQFEGQFEFDSLGGCTIYFSWVVDPATLKRSPDLFNCNVWFSNQNQGQTTPASRSELQIDGVDAYLTYWAQNINQSAGNLPALTGPARSYDALTGDDTLTWSEPIVKCTPGGYPPTVTTCADFVGTGVRADLTVHQDHAGRVARVIIHFVSIDARPHQIDALFDQEDGHQGTNGAARFSWSGSGFQAYNEGDTVAGPAPGTPGTVLAKFDKTLVDGNIDNPFGGITFANGPDTIRWLYGTTAPSTDRFTMHYARAIPAGGSTSFGWVVSQGLTEAEVVVLSQAAEASFRPSVAISSPQAGSNTSQPQVAVTGTAGDPTSPFTVAVNGVPATVQANGNWSATVPLTPGSNTLRATVTNEFGTTAADQRSVTYTPRGPVFTGARLVRLTYTLDKRGRITIVISCPAGANGRCIGRLTLTTVQKFLLRQSLTQAARKKSRRLRIGSSRFSIAAGKTGRVKVKISGKGRKLIAKRGRLAVALAMTSHDGSGVTRAASNRITIKAAQTKKRR